jgi:hypothetical protein
MGEEGMAGRNDFEVLTTHMRSSVAAETWFEGILL